MSDPIRNLIQHFSKLPGIGERTALRHVLHLMSRDRGAIREMAHALIEVAEKVKECSRCHTLTALTGEQCQICENVNRDHSLLCVVATVQDLMALESTGEYQGLYHVLHGTLSPMQGRGPKELRMDTFFERLGHGTQIKEIIMATPPTVEGEATALYIAEEVAAKGVSLTRIASGVPVGGDLQFSDRLSLSRALRMRRELS